MKKIFLLLCSIAVSLIFAQSNQGVFFKKFGIKKIKESSVGVYYARPSDSLIINRLDTFLLVQSERLFKKFNHRIPTPLRFEFYPSLAAAQCECGLDTLSLNTLQAASLGCAHNFRKIQMVLPGIGEFSDSVYFTWGGFSTVILHEYVHAIIYDIIGEKNINKIPWWITEGMACYEAKQFSYNSFFKEYILKQLSENKVPSVRTLNNDYVTIDRFYGWSYMFCRFIIDTYGYEKLLEIQKNFKKFPRILGKSFNDLNKEWLEYLKNKPIDG